MFQDPNLQLRTLKRSQQEHRDIAARHRLVKGAAAGASTERAEPRQRLAAPRRSRLRFRLHLRPG